MSTKPQFTPGPWEAIGYDDGNWDVLREGTNHFVCEVGTEATARLIAAAPDLYTALKECRDALAAAMRVIHGIDLANRFGLAADNYEQRFVDEIHAAGVKDGVGVRADAAVAKAEDRR